jgi:hypothetical protein
MDIVVAFGTESNKVLIGVVAAPAAKFLVMNLQIRHRPAVLAAPTVALEYLSV